MKNDIESRLNELSMLLVMTGGSDEVGLDACVSLVQQIIDTAGKAAEFARLVEACRWVETERKEKKGQDFAGVLENFVSTAQSFLNNSPTVKFQNEQPAQSATVGAAETGPNFDVEFLPEFIEKHLMLLEDFEGNIVDIRFQGGNNSEKIAAFNQYTKKYLHNIKGDAGSIGLSGVETVTHEIEDLFQNHEPFALLDVLVAYKEWVVDCCNAFAAQKIASLSSRDFLVQIAEMIPATSAPAEQVKVPTQLMTPVVSPEPVAVNHDLGSYKVEAEADIFAEFKAEAEDHLSNVESILLEKADSFSTDDIGTVFRGVHSLKGASSYFNLQEINKTSHILENLLDEVRDGKRPFDQVLVSLVFAYIDLQKNLLNQAKAAIERDCVIYRSAAVIEYLEQLDRYVRGEGVSLSAPSTISEAVEEQEPPAQQVAAEVVKVKPVSEKRVESIRTNPAPEEKRVEASGSTGDSLGIKTFVKVDTTRLDKLLDSIGEMVVYSSMLIRNCREILGDNEQVMKTSHQVEKFSRELQDIGMSMRLDPIKGLFQKMSRLVWDVSKKIGKEVNFTMKGEDTELDRTVIERLADPLMHMVRNALDHGIEPPEDRVKAGKPRAGTVELNASHEGGSILISIRDDGRGLDPAKLVKKAIEKGVIAEGTVLSDQEAFRLIFAAGFSTAQVVTDISGRGVGMDVVRNNIEGMRGQIHIESVVGKGSTFHIELPLTLAIMDGVETMVGSERFIVPTLSVLEFMKPSPEMITTTVGKGETFYFRGSYLPLYRLGNLFEIEPRFSLPTDAIVIVVESGTEQIALLVDDIIGSCQTVIKSLGRMFIEGKGLSGCAIMPNGSIGLILDVRSLVSMARNDYNPTRYNHTYRGAGEERRV